jgi:uracil phosphoribosyltransferase
MDGVTVIDHPLVQHKLTIMRKKETSTAGFRRLLREISTLLCYEVTRDLELTMERIETPLKEIDAPVLEGKKLVFASILRAGNGLLEGMLDLVPSARVAHIGVYRDHETLEAIEYYFKAPEDVSNRLIIVVDPMLATGNSSIASIDKLKAAGRAQHPLPVPAGSPRRYPQFPGSAPGRADLHCVDRQPSQRAGLHRSRARRRGRPHVRDQIAPTQILNWCWPCGKSNTDFDHGLNSTNQ